MEHSADAGVRTKPSRCLLTKRTQSFLAFSFFGKTCIDTPGCKWSSYRWHFLALRPRNTFLLASPSERTDWGSAKAPALTTMWHHMNTNYELEMCRPSQGQKPHFRRYSHPQKRPQCFFSSCIKYFYSNILTFRISLHRHFKVFLEANFGHFGLVFKKA